MVATAATPDRQRDERSLPRIPACGQDEQQQQRWREICERVGDARNDALRDRAEQHCGGNAEEQSASGGRNAAGHR
jgi:hypothetical protein